MILIFKKWHFTADIRSPLWSAFRITPVLMIAHKVFTSKSNLLAKLVRTGGIEPIALVIVRKGILCSNIEMGKPRTLMKRSFKFGLDQSDG